MKSVPLSRYCLLLGLLLGACNSPEQEGTAAAPMSGNPAGQKRIPVEAMAIQARDIKKNITITGIMNPKHMVDIVAEVAGKISQINKQLGQKVTKQDILALIDDEIPLSNYKQAKSQVLSAENNLEIARLNLQSDEELFSRGDISKLEYENSSLAVKSAEANHLSAMAALSLAEKAYHDTRINSPINGQIARKYIDIGTMVNVNTPLFRVVDLSTMIIEVGVAQEYISSISRGTEAIIAVSALPGETFYGDVRYISPQTDERTGSFSTEIYVKNTDTYRLRAGMTASVELILENLSGQIMVPANTVIQSNDSSYVYKISGNQASPVPVITGDKFEDLISVKLGLAAGDTIVTVGFKNLNGPSDIWIESVH